MLKLGEIEVTWTDATTARVRKVSPLSLTEHERTVNMTREQYEAWQAGSLIQDVLGHLTASEREFLINGVTEEESAMLEAMEGDE
jgi:hypothetical protein